MSEQGHGRKDPAAGDGGDGPAADAEASGDESTREKRTSTPLMEAAAKAAEQAHGDGDGEGASPGKGESRAADGDGGSDEDEASVGKASDEDSDEDGAPGDAEGSDRDGAPGEAEGSDRDDAKASGEKAATDADDASGATNDAGESGDGPTGESGREVDTEPPAAGVSKGDDGEDEEASSDGIRVRYYGETHVGLVRDHNEDNFMVADLTREVRDPKDTPVRETLGDKGVVLAVCDGMGGAAAGEVASQMAVDTVYEVLQAGDAPTDRDDFARRLVHSVEEAGGRIFSAAKMDRTRRGMGTTATVAGLVDKMLFVGQVGDSRAYVLRNGELGLITKDQSLVNQLIEAGQLSEEEAEAFEHSNIILQALGTTEEVTVDLTFLELRRGDRVMLCSDGLSGLVHPEMMRDVLAGSEDLQEACRRLIDMANAAGGHDNVTVVVGDFDGEELELPEGAPLPSYQQYPLPEAEEGDRQSLPPRETSIKEGGRKPGADVKRASPWGDGSESKSTDEASRTMRWWLVAAVLALGLIGAMVALSSPQDALRGEGVDPSEPQAEAEAEAEGPVAEPAPAPVPVTVTTDATGAELFVDGERHGALDAEQPLFVELAPGAYKLEARSDDRVVASANVTVRDGEPTEVALRLPEGRTGEPEPEEPEPAAPAP
ncbi:MAG: Stp1/IreP family PP2C-type Ser/Thr phosphatase, partial [Myxococcota bacterium]